MKFTFVWHLIKNYNVCIEAENSFIFQMQENIMFKKYSILIARLASRIYICNKMVQNLHTHLVPMSTSKFWLYYDYIRCNQQGT